MKRIILSLALALMATAVMAQQFNDFFEDSTLRLDYVFAGNHDAQQIYLEQMFVTPQWAGRKSRLAEIPLKGNGQLTVRDHETGQTLFVHTFSTLFQEWLSTAESKTTKKSFENVFLIPFPKDSIDITIELRDYHDRINATMTHVVDPHDILIRKAGERQVTPHITLQHAADTAHCIHIAYVAEGYQSVMSMEDGKKVYTVTKL